MTFRKFFYTSILLSIFIIMAIVSFNVYMNEYSLFGDAKGTSIKIWSNERTSKYLLSFNYIPANFEGILIGPSYSDNLDTKKISGYKIYNASLDGGGNISELKYIAENVIQRGNLKFIIICLSSYMIKNHGLKTSYISQQEYWASLGSRRTLDFYINKLRIIYGLLPDLYNDYGYCNFNLTREKPVVAKTELITKSHSKSDSDKNIRSNDKDFYPIDEIAYNELSELLALSRKKGVKVFVFYYPYYIENYHEKSYQTFKEKIDKLFDERDVIWDLNSDKHIAFRSDLSNYFDKGHLSWKGTSYLIREINNKLNLFYKRNVTSAKQDIP